MWQLADGGGVTLVREPHTGRLHRAVTLCTIQRGKKAQEVYRNCLAVAHCHRSICDLPVSACHVITGHSDRNGK